MKIHVCTPLLALSLLASTARSASAPVRGLALRPAEVVDLRGRCDGGLENLRAGKIEAPVALQAQERAGLRAVERGSLDLVDMRAGELSDKELTWLLIGAGIVLLIILL